MTVWFTADPHWGHEFVAKTRGFDNAYQHDMWLFDLYSSHFAPGDVVWWLGDLAMRDHISAIESCILTEEEADHHLIWGNHDPGHPMHRRAQHHQHEYSKFRSAQPFARRRIPGGAERMEALLCHFPYNGDHTEEERHIQYRLVDLGAPIIHGHTHSTEKVSFTKHNTIQVHVGIDAWRRPVGLEEVADIIRHPHRREN